MKKKIVSLLLACTMVFALTACGKSEPAPAPAPAEDAEEVVEEVVEEEPSELVDGKFAETRHIVVEIYDRGNDGGSDPTDNMYTEFIKKGMLEQHNVEVEFKAVPRWTEVEEINNLLAANDAPDVCVTYSYPTILTYANMGGVLDLAPLMDQYKGELPNLFDWLGDTNIYWDQDPTTGALWCVEAKLTKTSRINTFVRADWLEKLGLQAPTTKQEFEDMLIAFKDNAETLLGKDASKLIPYSVSYDVGWRAATLIESFMDPEMSDKEYYVNGFDDRKLTQNGTKEAVRLLNKWYNMGLMWNDFALYGSGDTSEDSMMKAGYVGAFTHNWEYAFRNGADSINSALAREFGEDVKFIAIDPFEDKNGGHTKFVPGPIDRKVFFPNTNTEPLASLLYLDFISDPEVIEYLQIGDEGVTHTKEANGAVATIPATGDAIQNSGQNIDYTITVNGLKLVDDAATTASLALNYPGSIPEDVADAYRISLVDRRIGKNVNVGEIAAEAGVGDTLTAKRDAVYDSAVVAKPEDFDKVWDDGIADYLAAGGQAIIDERTEKWEQFFGSADMLP